MNNVPRPTCTKCDEPMDDMTIEFIESTKGDREVPNVCGPCMLKALQEAIKAITYAKD